MTPNIKLLAWQPDEDPTTPGLLTDVENLSPSRRGYVAEMALTEYDSPTVYFGGTVYSAQLVKYTSFTPQPLFCTASKIYSLFGSSLIDLTRTTPYTAVTTPADAWRFTSFLEPSGTDVLLAISAQNPLQKTTNPFATKFTDVASAPTGATSICSASNFVLIVPTAQPDTVRWSALEDYGDWVEDLATQSSSKRLVQTPGGIVRLVPFRNSVLAFKPGSIIRGTWVNRPAQGVIWDFQPFSTSVGLIGHDAICEAEGVLYWVANDGIYRSDGSSVARVRSAPWDWIAQRVTQQSITQLQWDPVRRLVRFYFSTSAGTVVRALGITYHPDTDRWGRFTANASCVVNVFYNDYPLPTGAGTRAVYDMPAVVDATTQTLQKFGTTASAASFTTGDIGNGEDMFAFTGARFHYVDDPTTATGTHYYRQTLGETLTTGESRVLDATRKLDASHAARWHRIKVAHTGTFELQGMQVEIPPGGKR